MPSCEATLNQKVSRIAVLPHYTNIFSSACNATGELRKRCAFVKCCPSSKNGSIGSLSSATCL